MKSSFRSHNFSTKRTFSASFSFRSSHFSVGTMIRGRVDHRACWLRRAGLLVRRDRRLRGCLLLKVLSWPSRSRCWRCRPPPETCASKLIRISRRISQKTNSRKPIEKRAQCRRRHCSHLDVCIKIIILNRNNSSLSMQNS